MSETITVTGNVATEPQQRTIAGDVSVTSFRVACTHRRFDQESRAWVDAYTNYYSISAFRSLGRHAFASLALGDRVVVSGRLRLKDWDNGTRRGTTAEIDAESIGHDLLWGVTRFQRAGTQGASSPSDDDAPAPTPDERPAALAAADAWAVPAVEPAAVGETPF
jgi:single-strand DNA-binding protein